MRLEPRSILWIGLAAFLLHGSAFFSRICIEAQECNRIAGQWYCRFCHKYHPNSMVICPYNPSVRLQPQKDRFRESLRPSFTASSLSLTAGYPVELRWYSRCAKQVRIEPGIGEVGPTGMIRLRPTQTTEYRLITESDWSDWQDADRQLTIQVRPAPPEAHLTVSPTHVFKGDNVNLSWQTKFAQQVTIEPKIGVVDASGSRSISPLAGSTSFRLTAESPGTKTAVAEASVEVRPIPQEPEVDTGPELSTVFREVAPVIDFPDKQPKTSANYAPMYYFFPRTELIKLQAFVQFLSDNPSIHFQVAGQASEYSGSPERARVLANSRRDVVYGYLLNNGIAGDRMSRGEPVLVPGGRRPDAKSAVFLFNGVKPEIKALVVPSRVTSGEAAMLVWNSRYADSVTLPDGSAMPPSGMKRIVPSSFALFLLKASNSYGLVNFGLASLLVDPPPLPPPPVHPPSDTQLTAENMPDVFFPSGESGLDGFAKLQLDAAAAWLKLPTGSKVHIDVKGYCGVGEYVSISRQRAAAVLRYLQSRGVTSDRIRAEAGNPSDFYDADLWQTADAYEAAARRVRLVYDVSVPGSSHPRSRRPSQASCARAAP